MTIIKSHARARATRQRELAKRKAEWLREINASSDTPARALESALV
jgi:hypothetical protein